MTNLCDDCIHAMAKFERRWEAFLGMEHTNGYYHCIRLGGLVSRPDEMVWCKYHQTDDVKYRAAQDRGSEKIPGKVYRWDCCTISGKCFRCQYYHKPSEGTDPHKCPFGLKQRLRRIG